VKRFNTCLLGLFLAGSAQAANIETLRLWNGTPPLATPNGKPEAYIAPKAGMDSDITQLGNVSEPSLTVYHPSSDNRNGTCVLICPGGGYTTLSMKHEGTQVAEWLNSLGVTAVVLKYRVPAPKGEPPQLRPLLDAQRAMSLIRKHAKDWGVDSQRVGVLGFSAGGHLAAWLLCEGDRRAQGYPAVENELPCRPDFGVLVYSSNLAGAGPKREQPTIRTQEKPGPVFFVIAADDKSGPEGSIEFFLALRNAGVPGELHVFQQGGHGFGMLKQGKPVNDWPTRCADWLRVQNWLQPR
jgi:acetyl esterase/lipase